MDYGIIGEKSFFCVFCFKQVSVLFRFLFLFKYITNFASILECGLLLYDVFSIIRYDYLINGKNE